MKRKIWFNKTAAVVWTIVGTASFFTGWAYAIWFVVVCSIWANVFSSWSTAEAIDVRVLLRKLITIEENQKAILDWIQLQEEK